MNEKTKVCDKNTIATLKMI